MPNHIHGLLTINAPSVSGGTSASLIAVIAGFKAGVSRRVNALRNTLGRQVWQRSYYDRVVRDERELIAYQRYIADNPLRWDLDTENPGRK
jgi:REP element-mobilizing transposase RayT